MTKKRPLIKYTWDTPQTDFPDKRAKAMEPSTDGADPPLNQATSPEDGPPASVSEPFGTESAVSWLGWSFVIYPEHFRQEGSRIPLEARLAYWEAGLGGIQWLEDLSAQGKAVSLGGTGYPNRYSLKSETLLAVLAQGLPVHRDFPMVGDDWFVPAGWRGHAKIDFDRLRSLDPREMLAVDAWDQS